MSQDPGDMLQDDLEKFQQLRANDGERSLPALIEAVLGGLTALVGLAWLVALYWVPDTIAGQTWMGAGMLGLAVTGGPAAMVYGLRRGGVAAIRAIVRGYMR